MCSLDLEDVWRNYCTEIRSNKKRTSDQKIKSTSDYWLTSKQLQQPLSVRKCEINFDSHCDHSSVCMEIEKKAWQPKGPGFWKSLSSLLEDSDYIAAMAEKIKDLEDKGLLWEDKGKKMQEPRKIPHHRSWKSAEFERQPISTRAHQGVTRPLDRNTKKFPNFF